MADHSIRIGIESSEAKRGADEFTKSISNIQAAVAKVAGISGRGLPIGLDASKAREAVSQVNRSLRDLQSEASKSIKANVEADTSGAVAAIKRLRDENGRFVSQKGAPQIQAGVNTSGFEAGTKRIRDEFGRFVSQGNGVIIKPGFDGSKVLTGAAQVNRSLSDIRAEAAKTVRSAESIGSSFSNLAGSVRGLRGILATLGIGAAFKSAVDTIGAFEEQMSGIKAVTSASADEMAKMSTVARTLGATTKYSAAQAAEGMKLLGQAGFDTNKIIASMEGVLNLAAAGSLDLAKAAEISSNILSQFGMSANDMGKVADILAAAAARANTDVSDLGNAMKYVGPIAASLKISFADAAAAVAALSNSGIKGEQAGTAVRGVLSSLADPSKEAERAIKALGLTVESLDPSSQSFLSIMEKLRSKGLDASYAFKIFGQEGAPAVLSLTRNTAGLQELTKGMSNVAGEAKRMADTMSDNLRGDFKNLQSAAEELTLQVGDGGLLGGLRALTQGATGVVRVMAGMESSLGEQAQFYVTLTQVIQDLAVAIGTVYVARALGPMIARSVEAVRAQGALVAGMIATQNATAAQAATTQAAAAAAVKKAEADVAGAQAQLRMATIMDRGTGSMVAQRAAMLQLTAANGALVAAKAGAAAAEAAHATALAVTTVRARAAAAAMSVLNVAMAFLGGPIGAAITALAVGYYLLSQRVTFAEQTQKRYNATLDKMRAINADLINASTARRAELEAEREALLRNAEAELANLQAKRAVAAEVSAPRRILKSPIVGIRRTLGLAPDENEGDVKTFDNMVQKAQENLDGLRQEAAKPLPSLEVANNAPPEIKPPKMPDDTSERFNEQKRELMNAVEQQGRLSSSYDMGTTAVEEQTRAMDILNKVQSLNPKYSKAQVAELEKLITALYDAEHAAKFNEMTAGMVESGAQTIRLTDATLAMAHGTEGSAAAMRDEEAAIAARNAAIQLGVLHDEKRVASLTELFKAQQKTNEEEKNAKALLSMKRDTDATNNQTGKLDLKGEDRTVALAALAEEAKMLQENIDLTSDLAKERVRAAQENALAVNSNKQVSDIEDMQAQIDANAQLSEAMSLTGDAYIRKNAEIQKSIELERAGLSITSEYGQQQIQLAGDLAVSTSQLQNYNTELRRLATSIPNMSFAFDQAASGGLMHFEDALVDIVTGAKSAREAFADMAKSIAADLARMAIRMAIIQPLAMMFGGGFGGAVAAPVFGGFMSAAQAGPISWGPQAHTGGVIGSDSLPMRPLPAFHTGGVAGSETPMTRTLPAMPSMSSWPKFHSGGLAGNEVPSILKKGEGVFTAAQMAALAPVNNNTDNRGDSNVFNISVSVPSSGPGGGDPGAAERQGKIIAKQIQQAMNEHLSKNMRPGGLLNQSGY